MTPEMEFAQLLSEAPGTDMEKLASQMQDMSVEELEEIIRSEMTKEAQVAPEKEKKASAEMPISQEMFDKADSFGRELAHQHMDKTAAPIGAIGTALGGMANKVMSTGLGARAAVGAGVGAVGGLAGSSTDPATGKSNALKRMVGGAALGAGAGAAAPATIRAAGARSGAVSGAMAQAGKQSGNVMQQQAAQKVRGAYMMANPQQAGLKFQQAAGQRGPMIAARPPVKP